MNANIHVVEQATVLIVDDSKTYLHALSKLLRDDYRILIANNGFKSLELAASKNPPDLILLDIEMPEIDGYEVCRRLKEDSKTKDIPVIFVTGRDTGEDEEKGFSLGAVDYISKPFHPATVRARVKNQTERVQAEKEIKHLYAQLNEEVKKAERIHQMILPKTIPENEAVSIATHYQPATRMGGDFYNIIQFDHMIIIYLTDVMGHGMDGAMINVFAKETINGYIRLKPDEITPQKILQHLARQFHQENYPDDQLICVFLGVLNTKSMQFTYAGAGFQTQPLMVKSNGERSELICAGLPISNAVPMEMLNICEYSINLESEPGTTIIISTDGLHEQASGTEQFGDYYEDIFYQNAHLPPTRIVEAINEVFCRFNNGSLVGDDDITYLVLQTH